MRWFLRTIALGIPFAASACASDANDTDGNQSQSGQGGISAGAGAGTGGKSNALCEKGPGYAVPAEPRAIDEVSATLVDLDDQPVADELVQVCGTDICISGESASNGGVVIAPGQLITKPAFKFGEGKRSAKFAWLLPDGSSFDLGRVRTVTFPAIELGVPLLTGEASSSGGLTIFPSENGEIKIDRLTFRDPPEQGLRAVRIELELAPEVVDASLGFELLYAATPVDTIFCPPAALSIENSEGWAPGTAVEVWLHGVDIAEEWAPYGGFAKVSDAEVTADGARIETTSPGLPVLGVLGFKRP